MPKQRRANADALKLDASAVSAFGGTLVDDQNAPLWVLALLLLLRA